MTTTDGRPRSAVDRPGGVGAVSLRDGGVGAVSLRDGGVGAVSLRDGVAAGVSGGRHARPDDADDVVAVAPADYVPRHAEPEPVPVQRVRVVIADRRPHPPAVGTRVEIVEQSPVGEYLVGRLMKAQLALSLRLGAVAAIVLGSLPVLFATAPNLGRTSVIGIRLPWLLLGVLAYPFLLAVGWAYTRAAERNESDFTDVVDD